MKTAEFNYCLFIYFCKVRQNQKPIAYTNCVVEAYGVQTAKLTLFAVKYFQAPYLRHSFLSIILIA